MEKNQEKINSFTKTPIKEFIYKMDIIQKIKNKKKERKKKIIELFKIDENNCNDIEKKMLENDDMVTHHLNLRNILKTEDKFNETLIKQEFKELLEERVEQKFTKIKYVRKLMKELGLNNLEDIKVGNRQYYKNVINSDWILNNFDNIKNLFNFRGEKYDRELLNKEGGFQIVYFLFINMLKNLCGSELIETKRSHPKSNEQKITEYFINNSYLNDNKKIIDNYVEKIFIEQDIISIKNNKIEKNIIPIKGYLYIIHLREFIRLNENTYKIGRTQNLKNRKNGYSKFSEYKIFLESNDIIKDENNIKQIFNEKFTKKTYGNEYFEGNIEEMKNTIFEYLKLNNEKYFNFNSLNDLLTDN